MSKARVNVYLSLSLQLELDFWASKYNVTRPFLLQAAFKLCDRKELERFLELQLVDDDD